MISNNIYKVLTKFPYTFLCLYSLLLICISYISINTNSQIYDYPFHMARIVGLAQSISHGDFLPNLNFLFTHGSGYAVPMFYGNALLYIPAVAYLLTKIGTVAFTVYAFMIVFLTTLTSYYSLNKITKNKKKSILFAMTVATALPYFGFGMSAVLPLIPFLIFCIYKVLYQNKLNPIPLGITIALLIQTHVISTVVLAISSAIIVTFQIKKLSLQKILSFIYSVLVAILLSVGFIFQYLEQSRSQTFFVTWGLRDYPFPSQTILAPENLLGVLKNYYFPLSLIFLIIGFLFFKYLTTFSRTLLFTSIVLLIGSSNILPWQSFLRFTFLTVFQYTSRLTYFLPVFILMALFISNFKYLQKIIAVVQIAVYLITNPLTFLPNNSPYKEKYGLSTTNIEVMRNQNSQATNAYYNPTLFTYWSSGNEYFNLNINHKDVEQGKINQFIFDSSQLEIKNIKQSYNNLEFDVVLKKGINKARVILPRIWYKGYFAEYSKNAQGTQPKILYKTLSNEEKKEYRSAHKPNVYKKALYNGQGYIDIKQDGHVKINYRKTNIQLIGYLLEGTFWILLFCYVGFSRKRENQVKKVSNYQL